jgi:arylsulfatase A-like enzyme
MIAMRSGRAGRHGAAAVAVLPLLIAGIGLAGRSAYAADRPNLLIVFADQWRADATGYAGDPNVRTPHIDRLAAAGVSFSNAVSACPVCSPYRASLLTGQRPLRHGVFLNDVPLRDEAVTLAEVLDAAGYDTAYIGKWHLDGHGRSSYIPRERRQGFSYWKVLECTHDYNHSRYYGDGPTPLTWDGYDAIAQTRDARRYLEERAHRDKPFLLVLSWGPPHNPYETAPERYRSTYSPAALKLRPNVPPECEKNARRDLAGYYAHCTALDDCMGELLTALRESGLERRTVLLFTSDHGDMLYSHGQQRKQRPWDESVRVPLLVRWPGRLGEAGRRLAAPISTEDLMPTLLGLAGVPIPPSVEGLDFSGYIRGGKDPSDGAALIMCPTPFGEWIRRQGGREYRGIRTGRYTYVRTLKGPWLLYDNQADPYQLRNLCDRPEDAALQANLEATLQRKLKHAGDEFLPGERYLRLWGYKTDADGTVKYTN